MYVNTFIQGHRRFLRNDTNIDSTEDDAHKARAEKRLTARLRSWKTLATQPSTNTTAYAVTRDAQVKAGIDVKEPWGVEEEKVPVVEKSSAEDLLFSFQG